MISNKSNKTYKREFAVGCVLFVFYLAATGDTPTVEVLAGPVFLFTMAAFGLDAWRKQINVAPNGAGRDRRSHVGSRGESRWRRHDRVDKMDSDSGDSNHASRGSYSDDQLTRK